MFHSKPFLLERWNRLCFQSFQSSSSHGLRFSRNPSSNPDIRLRNWSVQKDWDVKTRINTQQWGKQRDFKSPHSWFSNGISPVFPTFGLNVFALRRMFSSAAMMAEEKPITVNIGASQPTMDTASVEFKEKLKAAQEEADHFPQNARVQAEYLKLLNMVDPNAVLRRLRGSYAIDEAVRKEFIKALVRNGELDIFPIDTLLKSEAAQQGMTSKNPIFVSMTSSWSSIFSSILMAVLAGVLLYSLLFRGGGIGDSMLGKQNMHNPVENSTTTFADVMGADEAKQELQDIVEYLKHPTKFSRLNAKLPKGVLLVGPPGCGKTLVARALAGEAGVPFFFASGSEFEEMFVGVGASRVRKLFERAKQMAPCVIFLDEIDAIGGRRDSPESRYHKMTLNQLLVELDGFEQHTGIVVVAATNLPDVLDPAITRPGRFDRTVTIPLPDVKARRDIIRLYLQGRAASDVNVDSLAKSTTGFSGAEIFNMVNIAAIDATKRNLTKIPMHLMEMAKDHVMMGPERKAMVITPETKKLTAYHESGHALVGYYTPGENEIVKATLVPRGAALGMVAWQPKDELLPTKEAYLARIDSAMGGRAAEELIFGANKVTPGAGSDFQQATNIARQMVMQFGMGNNLGKMAFSEREFTHGLISPETQRSIEQEIRDILEKSYIRAQKLLSEHKKELDRLATALLEYETLSLEEIKMVIEGKNVKAFIEKKRQEEMDLIANVEELYGYDKDSDEDLELKRLAKEQPAGEKKGVEGEGDEVKKQVLLQGKK